MARGATAVRLKDVAEEAGLTPGAVLYYYPNLDDLLVEVHHTAGERFCRERAEAVEREVDPRRRMRVAIRRGLPTGPEDVTVRTLYEMDALVGKSTLYTALSTSFFERQVAMYQVILEAGVAQGYFALSDDTVTIGRNIVALEDAYGLHVLAGNPFIDVTEAERLIVAYARSATGCDLEQAAGR